MTTCRYCETPLTVRNARRWADRFVGACRRCESDRAIARYHARREIAAELDQEGAS